MRLIFQPLHSLNIIMRRGGQKSHRVSKTVTKHSSSLDTTQLGKISINVLCYLPRKEKKKYIYKLGMLFNCCLTRKHYFIATYDIHMEAIFVHQQQPS